VFYLCRYFLRKLRKVKKANGQVLAVNEVSTTAASASGKLTTSTMLGADHAWLEAADSARYSTVGMSQQTIAWELYHSSTGCPCVRYEYNTQKTFEQAGGVL